MSESGRGGWAGKQGGKEEGEVWGAGWEKLDLVLYRPQLVDFADTDEENLSSFERRDGA